VRTIHPKTDPELFDLIHLMFGIGDFDEALDSQRWFQFRTREIAKIKAIRRKRRLSIEDLTMLATYCHDRSVPIKATFDLLEHWPAAVRHRAANERLQIDEEVSNAIQVERERADGGEWVDRFLRAQGAGRQILLNRWRKVRGGS
jgi:hypothetical protein